MKRRSPAYVDWRGREDGRWFCYATRTWRVPYWELKFWDDVYHLLLRKFEEGG